MKLRSMRSRWIKGAIVALASVAALGVKPVVDTWEDLERADRSVQADFDKLKRAGALAPHVSASSWQECTLPRLVADQTLSDLESQVGVVVLSVIADAAIADGCEAEAVGVSAGTLAEAFDERSPQWRWPTVATAVHAWYGHSEGEIAAGLRSQMIEQRAVAECVGSSARTLRHVSTTRPYTELAHTHDACQRAGAEVADS